MNVMFPANCNADSWCERWNIKIKEGKTWAIYFSGRLQRVPEDVLHLNGWDIP
jgi:hypothetical protein